MRRIIRDRTSDILLIISLMISFIILLYLVPLYDKLRTVQEDSDGYNYARYYEVDLTRLLTEDGVVDYGDQEAIARSKEDYFALIEKLGQIDSGNVYNRTSLMLTRGVSIIGGKVLIKKNEKVLEKFEDADQDSAAIVIGHDLDQFVEKGRLMLDRAAYGVDGYYQEEEKTCSLYVNLEKLDESHRTQMLENMYDGSMELPTTFCIAGESDITNGCQQMEQILGEYGVEYEDITEEYEAALEESLSAMNAMYKDLNKYSFGIALALALINCTQVSLLWIRRKRREMAVRKAFGYNNVQLYLENVKSLFKLAFIAAVCSVGIYLLLYYAERKVGVLQSEDLFSPLWLLAVLTGMVLISLLTSLPVMKQIIKVEPARGIAQWQ